MPSVRKSYDEELLQLDTLLARMGHEAGAAIESAQASQDHCLITA